MILSGKGTEPPPGPLQVPPDLGEGFWFKSERLADGLRDVAGCPYCTMHERAAPPLLLWPDLRSVWSDVYFRLYGLKYSMVYPVTNQANAARIAVKIHFRVDIPFTPLPQSAAVRLEAPCELQC